MVIQNKEGMGCGKVICVNLDYDGKMVICGKYGNVLCEKCKEKSDDKEMQQRVLAYMIYKDIWEGKKSIEMDKLHSFMKADGFLTKPMNEIRELIKDKLNAEKVGDMK